MQEKLKFYFPFKWNINSLKLIMFVAQKNAEMIDSDSLSITECGGIGVKCKRVQGRKDSGQKEMSA